MTNAWTEEIDRLRERLNQLTAMSAEFIGADKEYRSDTCIEVAIRWGNDLLKENNRLRAALRKKGINP